MATKVERGLLAVIALAALALRLPLALGRSFWYDEAMSWKIASYDWPTMLAKAKLDVHPPLYWALVKVQGRLFGDSALALRSLSLAQVPLQVALMAALCRWPRPGKDDPPGRLRDAAVIGGALVAFNPTLYMTTCEARMYAPGVTLALASALALLALLTRAGGETRSAVALGLLGSLFVYTHYHALFWLASAYLFGLGYLAAVRPERVRRKLAGLGASGVAIALAFAPWAPALQDQCAVTGESYWLGLPSEGLNPVRYLVDFWTSPRAFIGAGEVSTEAHGATVLAAVATLAALAWLGRRDVVQQMALVLLVLPVALAALAGHLGSLPTIHGRFLQFALVFSAVGPARTLANLPSRPLGLAIAAALATQFVYFDIAFERMVPTGIARALAEVRREARPGDLVYCNSSYVFFPTRHALRGQYPVYLTETSRRRFHCPFLIEDDEVGQPGERIPAGGPTPTIWAIEAPGKGTPVRAPAGYEMVERRTLFDFVPPYLTLARYGRRADADGR